MANATYHSDRTPEEQAKWLKTRCTIVDLVATELMQAGEYDLRNLLEDFHNHVCSRALELLMPEDWNDDDLDRAEEQFDEFPDTE